MEPDEDELSAEERPEEPHERQVSLSDDERRVLAAVLDRDRTARVVHGGLQGILGLSPEDAAVLLGFLRRAC